MRPIVAMTAAFVVGLLLVLLLPPGARAAAWAALGATYLLLVAWGVASMGSGIFGHAHTAGDAARARVALTYDDGPDPASTGALLDLLAERGVSAAFFVVGAQVRAHPDLARRCRAEGHLLANHSDRHSHWTNFLGRDGLRREIEACQTTLREVTDEAARYYRPPIGLMSPAVAPVTRALGLPLVGWQVRSLDTTARSPEAVARRVLARVRPGGIILLHDGGLPAQRVVAITRLVLDGLAARGLAPVRLDALLEG